MGNKVLKTNYVCALIIYTNRKYKAEDSLSLYHDIFFKLFAFAHHKNKKLAAWTDKRFLNVVLRQIVRNNDEELHTTNKGLVSQV